jgi:hypothetical protein
LVHLGARSAARACRLVFETFHGERLACARLAVGEDSAVETLEDVFDNWLAIFSEEVGLGCFFVVGAVDVV